MSFSRELLKKQNAFYTSFFFFFFFFFIEEKTNSRLFLFPYKLVCAHFSCIFHFAEQLSKLSNNNFKFSSMNVFFERYFPFFFFFFFFRTPIQPSPLPPPVPSRRRNRNRVARDAIHLHSIFSSYESLYILVNHA